MSDGDGAGGGKKRAREESELDAATSRCATEFIKINVGGKGYTALRSNLCADPNSMIAALAGGGCVHEWSWKDGRPLGGGRPGHPINERQVYF